MGRDVGNWFCSREDAGHCNLKILSCLPSHLRTSVLWRSDASPPGTHQGAGNNSILCPVLRPTYYCCCPPGLPACLYRASDGGGLDYRASSHYTRMTLYGVQCLVLDVECCHQTAEIGCRVVLCSAAGGKGQTASGRADRSRIVGELAGRAGAGDPTQGLGAHCCS